MSDYLLKALRSTAKAGSLLPPYPEVINAAADRIEQLEQALREIADPDSWEGMDWVGDGSPRWIARAALEKKDD
jgi:uncharacterized protein involved in copper resistance